MPDVNRRHGATQPSSSYTVSYDSGSHLSVLTQTWGSSWPKVLPYCIFNLLFMILLILWRAGTIPLFPSSWHPKQISAQGHTFLTLVVSFLLVSRVNTALTRYNAARDALAVMNREARALIQSACAYSSNCNSTDDSAAAAKEWRHEMGYQCLLLLRTAMAVIDYPTTKLPSWTVATQLLQVQGKTELQHALLAGGFVVPDLRRYAHSERTAWEETMRVPLRMAYLLRKTIRSQEVRLSPTPMQTVQEGKLMAYVDNFLNGFYTIRKFVTTPVPFPLIQMARTFLFLYVFTIPLVMLSDNSGNVAHCLAVFLVTYGFVGLEIVAMELDNPFGTDPNDFNNNALACTAYEDIYLAIWDMDGPEWADKLRSFMMTDDGMTTKLSIPTRDSVAVAATAATETTLLLNNNNHSHV